MQNSCIYDAFNKLGQRYPSMGGADLLAFVRRYFGMDETAEMDIQISPDLVSQFLTHHDFQPRMKLVVLTYGAWGSATAGEPHIYLSEETYMGCADSYTLPEYLVLVNRAERGGYGAGHYYLLDVPNLAQAGYRPLIDELKANGGSLARLAL